MKSAKKKPIESDEPGIQKHAPRPKFETFSRWEMYGIARAWWNTPSDHSWLCRPCSHSIGGHYRGWCGECRHECDGADALHDALIPLLSDMQKFYEKHAKLRQARP